MAIPDWDDEVNSFELINDDGLTHSTRDGEPGYLVGGPFSASEISQTKTLDTAYVYGTAKLTCWRANMLADDQGRVRLEALSAADAVLATATTGLEAFATLEVWSRRQLSLDLPAGTAKLRVRLDAARTAGSGNSGAAFDDFDLTVHKHLKPVYELAVDFRTLPQQPTPKNWQRFHLSYPDLDVPDVMLAHGLLAISAPRAIGGETLAWSDGTGISDSPFVAPFGASPRHDAGLYESEVRRSAFTFQASGPHLQLLGNGTRRRGHFASDEPFTVIVQGKWRAADTGVIGVRDTSTSIGWGMQITSSGNARATLQGASGTKTATSAAAVTDGAPHQLAMVYDPSDDTLKVYVDRRGAVSTSTASGMGEFELPAGPASTYPLRIGTDHASTDTMVGELLMVALFDSALTEAEIESMWTLGHVEDATITPTLSHAVWVPSVADDELDADVTLLRCATDQLPIGYSGDEHGIAITGASTNLWPSNDVTSTTHYEAESTVTVVRSDVQDNTGLVAGIRVTGDATHGLVVPGLAVGASSGTVNVVVFARALTGTPSLGVELLSSADVVKDSDSATLSTNWKRVAVTGLSWDGATATCKLRFRSAGAFELAHVAWAARVTSAGQVPSVIQDATVALSSVNHAITATHPVQLNHEGEVDVSGIATTATPLTAAVVLVENGTDTKNARYLTHAGSAVPRFAHYDSTPAAANANGSAIDWSVAWRLRGRWSRAGIPNGEATDFAGILVDASADSDVQNARTAAWTVDGTQNDVTKLGANSGSIDAYIRRLAVRSPALKQG